MSLQTWKEEFYPVAAQKTSKEEALSHSLQKWEGLTEENLQKHGLEVIGNAVRGDYGLLPINFSTCSLCFHFAQNECAECPITITTGKNCASGTDSPYVIFYKKQNPLPMIDLLEECMANKNGKTN